MEKFLGGLLPELADFAIRHIDACAKRHLEIALTSGWRSPTEQTRLWSIGRSPAGIVLDASKIVTNAKPDKAPHCRGAAYDACPVIDEHLAWTRLDLFQIMGEEGARLGLVWGGSWPKFKDLPHFELPSWRDLPLKGK